jgi:hypothetical protein
VMELLEGNLYVNAHTDANPAGEIRGQVYRYMREGYVIAPSGMQQVPPVPSSATGSGIVSIDRDQTNAHIMFVVTTDEIDDVHFHKAVAGTNGPVIFPMGDLIMDNAVFTYWDGTDATPFTLANSVQFRNDSIYLNVHTLDFPDGEIRGQVTRGSVCDELITELLESEANVLLGVWPVPVSDRLNIVVPANWSRSSALEVLDASGRMVRTVSMDRTDIVTVDVSDLQDGLYIVRLLDRDRSYATRFTKE